MEEFDEFLYRKCRIDALKCSFITQPWEAKLYAACLYEATLWGWQKDEENRKYFSKNHLTYKYKV